jgi:predicted nuclease of restriction endonuclease-like RecB superfamily
MALFQQSTRYGLKLALLVPHLLACKRASLTAQVRLRKGGSDDSFTWKHSRAKSSSTPAALSDVARALKGELGGGAFSVSEATEILRAPDGGLAIVPDLRLEHQKTGDVVYVEVLGFWSRAALWKRVDAVAAGFPYRVVFCASDRLRVSEAALSDDAPAALVVFKGVLRATRVLAAAEALIARS